MKRPLRAEEKLLLPDVLQLWIPGNHTISRHLRGALVAAPEFSLWRIRSRCPYIHFPSAWHIHVLCRLEDPGASAQANGESGFSAADKNARALRKKLKQVDALLDKQREGQAMTVVEKEKIAKASQWCVVFSDEVLPYVSLLVLPFCSP